MASDVSYGAFLSGGIDSSLVVSIMQSISKKPINTFSIGFLENKNDETIFAKEAANYLKTIGWKKNKPCFYKIELNENIPKKYLNVSAKKIHSKKKIDYFKKYIKENTEIEKLDKNLKIAIITPDKDIIPNAETLNPAYIVFDNYEIILKWNRSLRFALAVCTLKDKLKNEI